MRTWRLAATALCSIACDAAAPVTADVEADAAIEAPASDLAASLAAFEAERRRTFDPLAPRAWSRSRGAEPFAVARVDGRHAIGVLRGDRAVVLLDDTLVELHRVVVPGEPTGVAVDAAGVVHVIDTTGAEQRFVVRDQRLHADGVATGRVERGRNVLVVPAGLVVDDIAKHEIIAAFDDARPSVHIAACNGPVALGHANGLVAAACLFDRALVFAEIDARGIPNGRRTQVVQLAPFLSVSVAPHGDGWRVAAGGIEDHALDRSDGAFGYVDPFVFVFDVTRCDQALCAERVAAIDVGEWGVVTPKWVDLRDTGDGFALTVAGYGSDVLATATIDRAGAVSGLRRRTAWPGLRQLARLDHGFVAANPLLDAWSWIGDDDTTRLVATGDTTNRDTDVRLGEALFFTTALAPGGDSEGAHSRFTCETCHFEGTVDGRIHYTGREDIHAATKPLLGLFVNPPHFSRALDRSLGVMVDNEFGVANRLDPGGPEFDLSPVTMPWLREIGVTQTVGPEAQRRAFMRFFEAFDHEPSPAVAGRSEFTALERRGAALFAEHCESCHQARLVTDDASTRVDATRWESLVFSETGPLVWATEQRMRTGVLPYVHPEGARVTSLRRVAIDWPYLTNGSARSLDELLARIQLSPERIHAASGPGPRLGPEEVTALRGFLDLL